MGRSQVLRNRLNGRGRGKGRTGKSKKEKGHEEIPDAQKNSRKSLRVDHPGDNLWRYSGDDKLKNSDEFLNNEEEQIDVTTSYLLSQYDQAISSSYYQSRNSNHSNQLYDDDLDTNDGNAHSHHYEKYISNFQSPAFSEAMNSLRPSTRLRLSSEIAEEWDDLSMKGYTSAQKKTLAELRIDDLKIDQSFRNEFVDSDSREDKIQNESLYAGNKFKEANKENPTKCESNPVEQQNKDNKENSTTKSVHNQEGEEIDDLDSWLDDTIKVQPKAEIDNKTENHQKQDNANKTNDIEDDESDEEEDLDAWLDSVIA